MSAPVFEFIRLMAYTFEAAGLVYMGIIIVRARSSFYALAAYSFMLGLMQVIRIVNYDIFRDVSNYVVTPSLLIVVILVFFNLWKIRKD